MPLTTASIKKTAAPAKKAKAKTTPATKSQAAPEKTTSKKTDPSVQHANPAAKTEGQRQPDVKNEEAQEKNMVVPVKSFTHPVDGKDKKFVKGETRVSADHPMLAGIEHLFEQVA